MSNTTLSDVTQPDFTSCDGLESWRRHLAHGVAHLERGSLAGVDAAGNVSWVLRHAGIETLWAMVAPLDTVGLIVDLTMANAATPAVQRVVIHPEGIDVANGDRTPGGAIDPSDPGIDIARRILRLPTEPERRDGASLALASWLELVVERVAEMRNRGRAPLWAEVAAMHPSATRGEPDISPEQLGRRTRRAADALGWERLRRGVAAGDLVVAGATPIDAEWMDAGMFARSLLSAHREVSDLLADLGLLVPNHLVALIRRTVEATNSKVSPSSRNERGT